MNCNIEAVVLSVKACYEKFENKKTDKIKGSFVEVLEIEPINKTVSYSTHYLSNDLVPYKDLSLLKPFDAILVTCKLMSLNNQSAKVINITKREATNNELVIRY